MDVKEHDPDLHLFWNRGKTRETLINKEGEIVLGHHHGHATEDIPDKHRDKVQDIVDAFNQKMAARGYQCVSSDAELDTLLSQTLYDERDILPDPIVDLRTPPFPALPAALSPDGIEPDESLDLLLLDLLIYPAAPEIVAGPEAVGPPPVDLPLPNLRGIPVPQF